MEKSDFVQMMKGYSEVQKTYTQYAVASLLLPITFLRDLLEVPKGVALQSLIAINDWLLFGWVGLIVCLASSMAYQTVAARRIAEYIGGAPVLKSYPRIWFNLATAGFFVGILCLFLGIVTTKSPSVPKPELHKTPTMAPKQ